MNQKVIDLVDERYISSSGKCGMYFTEFILKLNISRLEFENLITEMSNNEEVDIRSGINGLMVMKKQSKKK